MTILKKFIDREKVKLTAYNGLWFWGVRFPGIWILPRSKDTDGALIFEVHGFGFALELVFE